MENLLLNDVDVAEEQARPARLSVTGYEKVPGHGALATVGGHPVAVGNARLMAREKISLDGLATKRDEMAAEGRRRAPVEGCVPPSNISG